MEKLKQQRIVFIFFLVSLFCYICFIATLFFPFESCGSKPVVKYDFAYHYVNALGATEYYRDTIRTWGYNPYFRAGHVDAIAPSGKILVPINVIFSMIPPGLRFNMAMFLIFFILPFLFMRSILLFEGEPLRAQMGFFACSVFLMSHHLSREFFYIGHFGFLIVIFLSLISSGHLWQFVSKGRTKNLWLFCISSSIAFWSHPAALIFIFPVIIKILIKGRHSISKNNWIKFAALCLLLIVLPNLNYYLTLVTLILFGISHSSLAVFLQSSLGSFVENVINPLGIAIIGISVVVAIKKQIKCKMIAMSAALYFAFAIGGSFLGLGDMQPVRFYIPALLFLIFLIVFSEKKYLSLLMVVFSFYFIYINVVPPRFDHRFGCGADGSDLEIINFMKKNFSPAYRVQVEDSTLELPFLHSRLIPYLQYETGLPFLASQYVLPYNYCQLVDGQMGGKSLVDFRTQEIWDYIRVYNVGYFIVFSDLAKRELARFPFMKSVYKKGRFEIFEVEGYIASYCYNCNADLEVDFDKIEVKNAKEKKLILKIHYIHQMRVFPSNIEISPIFIGDDPRPFIQVRTNGVSDFLITIKPPIVDFNWGNLW